METSELLNKIVANHQIPWLRENLTLLVRHGSQAYGLSTPESDLDIKGVVVPSVKSVLCGPNFEQAEGKVPEANAEYVIYEARKFCKLARDCNPTIIEVLFVEAEDILFANDGGFLLREHRDAFLSKKAVHSFSGYAMSQLKRITGHYRWLRPPPKTQEDLGLTEWNHYQTWLKTRNPKRAALEEKFGYDTKHAMHLVRLMRTCDELLRYGTLKIRRPDREELLAIRNGDWTYEKLLDWAKETDTRLQETAKTSCLPNAPNQTLINDVLMAVFRNTPGWEYT